MSAAIRTRGPLSVGFIAVVILVGGFGGWGMFTTLAGAVVAPGKIEVDRNRQVVQHPEGGVVSEILVGEGDTVAAQDMLVRLDPSVTLSQLAIVENELFELMARRARLVAERDGASALEFDAELLELAPQREDVANVLAGQERLFEARNTSIERETEELQQRVVQLSRRMEGIDAQQTSVAEQLSLMREDVKAQEVLLERGLTQASQVRALRREEAQLAGTAGELIASRSEVSERMTETRITIIRLAADRREQAITELRDIQSRVFELRERRRALSEKLTRLDIRAPVAGVVLGLQVFAPQSVVSPAEPVMFVVPQDRPLVITAQVEPIHIEQVALEQRVSLRFSGLDQRTTPELDGRVVRISPDTFTDEMTGMAYYRAEIHLVDGELARLPDGVALIPGMPVEAYIRTRDRTPLAYLVEPLMGYVQRAFREG